MQGRFFFFLLALIVGITMATSIQTGEEAPGNRVLVLLSEKSMKGQFSRFMGSLEARGMQITYAGASDSNVRLKDYGRSLFDHVIIFASNVDEFGGSLGADAFEEFLNEGKNILVAADGGLSEELRVFLGRAGMEVSGQGKYVTDHFLYSKEHDEGDHTTIEYDHVAAWLGVKGAVELRGLALYPHPANKLWLPIVTGASTSFSAGSKGDGPVYGPKNHVVSGLQARNNARLIVSGSLDLFKDPYANWKSSGALAAAVGAWMVHEIGHVRVRDVHHHYPGQESAPEVYYIYDNIEYEAVLEEWTGASTGWQPYCSNASVQLEFAMLDPYLRSNVPCQPDGRHKLVFQAPDVYGVFTFRLEAHRPGYTSIRHVLRHPVRPLRHDMYERFIPAAYPYYAGAASMIVSMLAFSVLVLWRK